MTWNLFLDDLRELGDVPAIKVLQSPDPWIIARNSSEAKALVLTRGVPKLMSLDHDLGGDDTSMVFLKWLANDTDLVSNVSEWPGYIIHSANRPGSENISSFMDSWKRSLTM